MQNELIFQTVLVAFGAAFAAIRIHYHHKASACHDRRQASREDRRAARLRAFTGLPGGLALLAGLLLPGGAPTTLPLPEELRWLGVALALPALGLLLWVHIWLDTNFSPTLRLARGHRLVTGGPYRRVRHPMYTALLLFGLVVFLLSADGVIGFVTLPGHILATLLRIPQEEAMLVEKFGRTYQSYQARTGLLLPRY